MIIGIYIVFVDGDDMNGLVFDLVWGILDGYIVFICELVIKNYYFVIDVFGFVSWVMEEIVLES